MNISKKFLLFLCTILIMAGGCKPENLDPYEGTASAMLNGKPWKVIVNAGQLPNEPGFWTLHLMQWDKKQERLYDQLSFRKFKFPVSAELKPLSVYNFDTRNTDFVADYHVRLFDGDVGSNPWRVMRAGPSQYLEITRYDSVTQEVEGVFSMTLHKYVLGQGFVPDDSVVFTQGTFKTRIKMW